MKTILGQIDCPTCATPGAMQITHDKNGEPFGFCADGCGQQLRIGGQPARIRSFVARFPWAAKSAPGATAPAAPVPVTEPAKPVTVTEAKLVRSAFADALKVLGV